MAIELTRDEDRVEMSQTRTPNAFVDSAGDDHDAQTSTALDLFRAAEDRGIPIRLIGGIAVAIHSPSASHRELKREYADIDFVATGVKGADLDELFGEVDYEPDVRFNAIHGRSRRLYFEASGEKQIDVFLDTFEMCHSLPFSGRLEVDSPTIPVAELLLSKTQIVELNRKDLLDIVALLTDHEIGSDDDDRINAGQIADLTGRDWGLWRTTRGTLEGVIRSLPDLGLDDATERAVVARAGQLIELLDGCPKSLKWKARARVGDRVKWYEIPEDPRRSPTKTPEAQTQETTDHDA